MQNRSRPHRDAAINFDTPKVDVAKEGFITSTKNKVVSEAEEVVTFCLQFIKKSLFSLEQFGLTNHSL